MLYKDKNGNILWHDKENSYGTGDVEDINLTDIFGKGNEPKTDDEIKKMIREAMKFFEG